MPGGCCTSGETEAGEAKGLRRSPGGRVESHGGTARAAGRRRASSPAHREGLQSRRGRARGRGPPKVPVRRPGHAGEAPPPSREPCSACLRRAGLDPGRRASALESRGARGGGRLGQDLPQGPQDTKEGEREHELRGRVNGWRRCPGGRHRRGPRRVKGSGDIVGARCQLRPPAPHSHPHPGCGRAVPPPAVRQG